MCKGEKKRTGGGRKKGRALNYHSTFPVNGPRRCLNRGKRKRKGAVWAKKGVWLNFLRGCVGELGEKRKNSLNYGGKGESERETNGSGKNQGEGPEGAKRCHDAAKKKKVLEAEY